MNKIRTIVLSIFLIFLFVEIWIGFPIQLEKGAELAPINTNSRIPEVGPEKKMENVHLIESKSGKKDWELFAQTAEGYEGEGSWELKNVKVQFYSGDRIEFTVTGDLGVIDSKSKNMKIQGKVTTESRNGYRFNTEAVQYESENRTLKSQDKVHMSAPLDYYGNGMTVDGDWMEALVDENLMKIRNRVTARKILKDGKKFLINSGTAEFSGQNKQARFLDQVSVEMDNMKLEGPEANFVYRNSVDALQSVMLKGGVRVSDLEKYATSESVQFDPSENKITLSGKPRVVQQNDEISGDRIVLIDGGKKIKVEKMKARVEKIEE